MRRGHAREGSVKLAEGQSATAHTNSNARPTDGTSLSLDEAAAERVDKNEGSLIDITYVSVPKEQGDVVLPDVSSIVAEVDDKVTVADIEDRTADEELVPAVPLDTVSSPEP
jgi:hypothetical protein